MAARLIDGKAYAQNLKDEVRQTIASIASGASGRVDPITLAAVQIDGSPGGVDVYAASQKRCAESVGIAFHHVRLPAETTEETLCGTIESLNQNPSIHGILLLRPLPDGIDDRRAACCISPDKDVEGQHPANLGSLVTGSAMKPWNQTVPGTVRLCWSTRGAGSVDIATGRPVAHTGAAANAAVKHTHRNAGALHRRLMDTPPIPRAGV